jgi:hypothetical protein
LTRFILGKVTALPLLSIVVNHILRDVYRPALQLPGLNVTMSLRGTPPHKFSPYIVGIRPALFSNVDNHLDYYLLLAHPIVSAV